MQAINTKFLPCTNTRGSRVKAECWLTSKTMSWEHGFNPEQNHVAAINLLVNKLNTDRIEKGNSGRWYVVATGSNPKGDGYTAIIDLDF